jgi:hypothetical protein
VITVLKQMYLVIHTLPHYLFKIRFNIIFPSTFPHIFRVIRGPFEKFVDWQQCAAITQREAVTVMPNCNGGGNVVVA